MPTSLETLSQEDRSDFEARVAVFGLTPDAIVPELILQPRSRVTLSSRQVETSHLRPSVLQIRDLSELKRMIGVDDRVFDKTPQKVPLPSRMQFRASPDAPPVVLGPGRVRRASALRERRAEVSGRPAVNAVDAANIRAAARAYVRGDSRMVEGYKNLAEQFIGVVELPVWVCLRIFVPSGSVLEFGGGINVLVAWEIEIEDGGKITSAGHLAVSCTRLKKRERPWKDISVVAAGNVLRRRDG